MGTLSVARTDDDRWRVSSFEQGGYDIDRTFDTEDGAVRFFLKNALPEMTFRKDFDITKLPPPQAYDAWQRRELERYGLAD
jgi:hypothetical protein